MPPLAAAARGGTIAAAWELGGDPALLARPGGGLYAFFPGVTPLRGMVVSTASRALGPWSPPSLVETEQFSVGRTPAATMDPTNTFPILAWHNEGQIVVHPSLNPGSYAVLAHPGVNARPNIVTTSGTVGREVLAVSCSYTGTEDGVIVSHVDPGTGNLLRSERLAGSVSSYEGQSHSTCNLEDSISRREPVVANPKGSPSAFVAGTTGYPVQGSVVVWRLGLQRPGCASNCPITVAQSAKLQHFSPAIDVMADGRFWVAWLEQTPTGVRIVSRRSNRSGVVVGAPDRVTIAGAGTAALNVSILGDHLEALLLSDWNGGSLFGIEMFPGLSLSISQAPRLRKDGSRQVKAIVTDAGDAVPGATVSFAGKTFTTDSKGVASMIVRHGGVATASRNRYIDASARFECC
jgi:hypothetical protein